MILSICFDSSVGTAIGFQPYGFESKPQQGYILFIFVIYYKCSKKFNFQKIEKILPYP